MRSAATAISHGLVNGRWYSPDDKRAQDAGIADRIFFAYARVSSLLLRSLTIYDSRERHCPDQDPWQLKQASNSIWAITFEATRLPEVSSATSV